jgi:hypothetical protein
MELWQLDVMGGVRLSGGTQVSVVTGIDDHSRFCVMAKLVERATANPSATRCSRPSTSMGSPSRSSPTFNGRVFTGKLAHKPATVLFDRICLNNGIKHILTAPYSPTTTGKIERLHKTLRKEFFSQHSFDTIEQAQAGLDAWVAHYNHDREHQAIGDVAPIGRFALAEHKAFEIVDGDVAPEEQPPPRSKVVGRRVDQKGRISILKHRYHIGVYLAGQTVSVESKDGLLHVSHHGVVVATHARRHLAEDDDRMDRSAQTSRPARPCGCRKLAPTPAGRLFRGCAWGTCELGVMP